MTHLDPVCGMTIDEVDAVGTHQHDGVTYFFCNPGCLERFQKNPQEFLEPVIAAAPTAPAGATFICPMDPDVHFVAAWSLPEVRHGARARSVESGHRHRDHAGRAEP